MTTPAPAALDSAPGSGWLARGPVQPGILFVLGAALCWSTSGTFVKTIVLQYGLSPWTLAFWRDGLTFVVLLLIRLGLGPAALRVAWRDWPRLALLGAVGIGVFHVTWAIAVTLIPVAIATVLNYTAPVFVALLAWGLWHERPSRRQWTALGAALAGCVLVTGAYRLGANDLNWAGILIGLSTGLTYGAFTIISKPLLARYNSWTVLVYAFGFGALTVLILRPDAPGPMLHIGLGAWLWLAALVLVSTVSGFALYAAGLRRLSAASASITATCEPIMAAGLAFWLLHETVTGLQALGGALVIGAVISLSA